MSLRDTQIRFLVKFAHLYDSGVPLAEALEIARTDMQEPVHGAIAQVVEDLYRGSSLADAMGRRSDAFGPEIVGIIRSGEQRGDLGDAARNAADGLRGRILEPGNAPTVDIETVLGNVGDARIVHLEPDGRVRLRTGGALSDGGDLDTEALIEAFAYHAGIEEAGSGAFLWNDRLVRVTITPTTKGLAATVRLSGEPTPEPDEARAWREGRPGLLLVVGSRYSDEDACLRGIVAAIDRGRKKVVAVGLPVPEVTCVADLGTALEQDPDFVCLAYLPHDYDLLEATVQMGIHVVAAVPAADVVDLPHRLIRLAP